MQRRAFLLASAGMMVAAPAGGLAAGRPDDRRAPSGLMVDLRSEPTGIDPAAARLSWLAPSQAQVAFQIQAATSRDRLVAGRPDHDGGRVAGAASTAVKTLRPIVEPGGHGWWRVRTWDQAGRASTWSAPQRVIGAAPEDWRADPIWIAEPAGPIAWLLARLEFDVPDDVAAVWVHATATSPEPARQYVFRMTLNDAFVGVGPVRAYDAEREARYATFDLTDRVKPGRNTLAALCYAAEGRAFLASLTILRATGERIVIGTGPRWRVLAGDRWRPPSGFTQGGWYQAAQEYVDARQEPVGWRLPGFDDQAWAVPETRTLGLALRPQRVDPMTCTVVKPQATRLAPGRWLFDLGREIAGGVRLTLDGRAGRTVEVRLGEERSQDGGARYALRASQVYREVWTLRDGPQTLEHWGFRAFRWIELLADPSLDLADAVVGLRLAMPWNDQDSAFASSSPDLDRVWAMCRYSIEALRFDVYQDTPSREREPYEGDAIVNQLSEQAVQRAYGLSRYSTGYLARRPTWPTEYRMQTPILAWRDYMATGDLGGLEENYNAMVGRLRLDRFNADGLVENDPGRPSVPESDLVDWPIANRDNFVFTRVNAVVNMWQYASLAAMADIARATGRTADARRFSGLSGVLRERINAAFLGADGTYLDGLGVSHRSQHATAFAVALGVIPDSHRAAAGKALAVQGMRMSVYGAQFLLEALYRAGQPEAALALMTSRERFSWLHMMDALDATITTEAWDPVVKPNTTFSHAWGTAPANIVQRFVAGVQLAAPGAARLRIAPEPSGLARFEAKVPTIRGAARVAYDAADIRRLLAIDLPANASAEIELGPRLLKALGGNGLRIVGGAARRTGDRILVAAPAGGVVRVSRRG